MTTLHLGCGLVYRPGAINIDRFDLTAADLQADAVRLPFPPGSVARIEACHLVEHLGYAGTLYALAEWRRVLEPGGTLLVETPDRLAACLVAAQPDPPAPALHGVFGLPWPGYEHRTLFDEKDLRALVEGTGFTPVEIIRSKVPQPTVCVEACKTGDPLADLHARLRTGFVAAGIVEPLTAPPHLAHLETICQQVTAAVEALTHEGWEACLATVLGAAARHDPRLAEVVVQILIAQEMVPAEAAAPYLHLARLLSKEAFPARLAAYLRRNPTPPGTQAIRLRRLDDATSLYLTARLHPDETALYPIREAIDRAAVTLTPADREITFFCTETIAGLSRRETARGVRAFGRGNLGTARGHLEAATAYDADNPLPVWNLARLALAEGHRLDALKGYAALLELLPGTAGTLQAELDAVTGRDPDGLSRLSKPVDQEPAA